jgi:hypothetical protein
MKESRIGKIIRLHRERDMGDLKTSDQKSWYYIQGYIEALNTMLGIHHSRKTYMIKEDLQEAYNLGWADGLGDSESL